jgi:hypothetical protein|tara:strand:+ start:961 stop:1230 length:270 start_codon:yes stop_codon:yes gene_type:complete
MGRRNKSRFERWFSLGQQKMRAGAKKLSDQISTDFSNQKQIIISGIKIQYTHDSSNPLDEYLEALRVEYFITNYDSYVNDNEAKLDGDN